MSARRRWALHVVRYGLPGVLIAAGMVLLVVDSRFGFEGWAMFTGSGLAILFLNVLFRLGVGGDEERHAEDAARDYFKRHGRWPDEPPR